MTPSNLRITDHSTNLVSLTNQANSVLLNNGAQPLWQTVAATNLNFLSADGVTNQLWIVNGVLTAVVPQ